MSLNCNLEVFGLSINGSFILVFIIFSY